MNNKKACAALRYHTGIGRKIRRGSYNEHAVSTYTLAEQALAMQRFADAKQLGRYTVQEALEAHELYRDWLVGIRTYLLSNGVEKCILHREEKRIKDILKSADKEYFDPEKGWRDYCSAIEDFALACDDKDTATATALLDTARLIWLDTHDKKCNWVYALLDIARKLLGEDCIGELWDTLMAPMYAYYSRYDVNNNPWQDSFDLLMQYALEGLRGHLSGPERRGDIEVFEEAERWGMRFKPCGSGGRTYLTDSEKNTPLMEPPFNLAVTTREHDWAWNKKGICLYCVHCCALNERMPMRRFGYPTRVVEPPTWPDAKGNAHCTWYVYKNPALVPDSIYRRVGLSKPQQIGSSTLQNDNGADDS